MCDNTNRHHVITLSIHGTNRCTFVYTPGKCSRPHPMPHETKPINVFRPSNIVVNGPPESPCNQLKYSIGQIFNA